MKFVSCGVSRVVLAALLATGQAAFAQTAPDGEAVTEEAETIVVTAQRRSENVQNVPISVAAFSSAALETANVDSVLELSRVAPNFTATRAAQAANVRLTVRGIGAAGNTAAEPSVAAFVDGIYVPRPGSIITTFLDMEGVEVLRGPQGTLFGRNASVGAISLRTARPTMDFGGELAAEAGTGDRWRLSGKINVPLGEHFAIRIAALHEETGGLWHNALDGEQYGALDTTAVRASARADLGTIDWTVRADFSEAKGDGVPNIDLFPASISAAQTAALRTRLGGLLPDTNLDDRVFNQAVFTGLEDRHWGLSSDLSIELGEYTVRLINSYRDWQNEQLDGDVLFLPIPVSSRFSRYDSESHNHELQLISPKGGLLGGALDFVAGAYYFREDYRIGEITNQEAQYCNVLVGAAQRPACQARLNAGAGRNATDLQFAQTLDSFALFGQATFHLAETIDLTLGARWTDERKRGSFVQVVNNSFSGTQRAAENTPLSLDDDRLTYRASLNWRPSTDLMLFANYSTGFKSGGFSLGGGVPALGQRRLFARETVENYELGVRSEWLDRDLVANLTMFRMDIAGYQDRSFDGVSFIVRNAGELRHQGFELDMRMRPSRNFSVTAALAYLDSKFTSYPGAAALPGIGGTRDLTGGRAHIAPELTGSVGADWKGDFGSSGWSWQVSGNLSFTSDFFQGGVTDNNPQVEQDGYALAGARIAVNAPDDRFTLAVFGSNLTDQAYAVGRFYQPLDQGLGLRNGVFAGSTAVRGQRGEPRTFGASLTWRF